MKLNDELKQQIFGDSYDLEKEILKKIHNSVLFSKVFLFIAFKKKSKENAFKLKDAMLETKCFNRSFMYQQIETFILSGDLKNIRKRGEKEMTYLITDSVIFENKYVINEALKSVGVKPIEDGNN